VVAAQWQLRGLLNTLGNPQWPFYLILSGSKLILEKAETVAFATIQHQQQSQYIQLIKFNSRTI
jgi:hypothetical protein